MHDVRNTVHLEHLLDEFFGQNAGFMGVDVNPDDVARVDVDHHVGIEVGALDRAGELGDVPRIHLPRCGRDQLRARFGRMPRQPTTLLDLLVLVQHPVHRGHRTQVDALVEQLGIDLQRRQIDKPLAGEHRHNQLPLQVGHLVDRLARRTCRRGGRRCGSGVAPPDRCRAHRAGQRRRSPG